MAGKRIGFVDHNLDNFHANVYLKLLRNQLADRGFVVAGGIGSLADESRAWAEANDVPYFTTVKEMDGAVDCYMVLAPSDPDTHWKLCKKVLPRGKTTYVDKTFAPDLKTAKRIFDLADKHDVAVQTSSALRYSSVQQRAAELEADGLEHMIAWGGGSSFGEYAIHPVELVISCMGRKARRLMRRNSGDKSQLLLEFSRGRTAVINVYTNSNTPFAAAITTSKDTVYVPVANEIFHDQTVAILDFFETGISNIDRRESLMVRRILDVAEKKRALKEFVEL